MQATKKRCDECGAKKSKPFLIETSAYTLCNNCASYSARCLQCSHFSGDDELLDWVNGSGPDKNCKGCGGQGYVFIGSEKKRIEYIEMLLKPFVKG